MYRLFMGPLEKDDKVCSIMLFWLKIMEAAGRSILPQQQQSLFTLHGQLK